MIISRTPFRISFFGGGTDYPTWVERHGGAVISTSFDKYCYVTCRQLPPFFDHKYRIAYSRIENAKSLDDIEHPAVQAVIREMRIHEGLEIHVDADLPARSGLGSSSSFVVGLLNVLKALRGQRVTREWLATEAIRIEQKVLAENVGYQDQVAAAYGGLNTIHFSKDGGIRVEPVVVTADRQTILNDHLMLFFTGFTRFASEVAKSKIENIDKRTDELKKMRSMVDDGLNILCNDRDIREFGELLHNAWAFKKSLSEKISNSDIDNYYAIARSAGAIGGKLLGAGGGGFLLLFVEPGKHHAVRQALSKLIHVPFKFESSGSQVIYYQP